MKKFLVVVLALVAGHFAQAQEFKFGIKLGGGIASGNLRSPLQGIETSEGKLTFTEGGTNASFHVGATTRIGILGFFIMPELYYTSITNEVSFEQVPIGSSTATIIKDLNETVNRIDMPVLIGVKLGKKLRINGGPVASLVVSKNSGVKGQLENLFASRSVDEATGNFTFGFQAGAGIDISTLSLDLRYEGNLGWLGSNIDVGNQEFNFDSRTSQVLLSLGLMF